MFIAVPMGPASRAAGTTDTCPPRMKPTPAWSKLSALRSSRLWRCALGPMKILADQTIDLDPDTRDVFGLPVPRITYDWRRPNERARIEYLSGKLEEIARASGASMVWRAPTGNGAPGAHHEGGTRMGSDPKTSVVNRYAQSWDVPNLFIVGSSTFPTMGSGFNPTLTIQALAYMTADAIVNRYRKNPGPLV